MLVLLTLLGCAGEEPSTALVLTGWALTSQYQESALRRLGNVLSDTIDEVVVAMFISGGDNSTLTRNMFNALRDQIDPTIASISTIMIGVTTVLMVLAQVFGQQKKAPK